MRIRYRKLVDKGLQTRMAAWFLICGTISVGLQFILTVNTMTSVALENHTSPADAYNAVAAGASKILFTTLLLALPISALVGILVSFRVCGPLVAMRNFLSEVAAGRTPQDVRLRKGDELQEFAELLNEATRPLREQEEPTHEQEAPPAEEESSQAA